jgi:hypothetical protein
MGRSVLRTFQPKYLKGRESLVDTGLEREYYKMNLNGTIGSVEFIHLAHWRALADMIMKFKAPTPQHKAGHFLTNWETVSFSRYMFHKVTALSLYALSHQPGSNFTGASHNCHLECSSSAFLHHIRLRGVSCLNLRMFTIFDVSKCKAAEIQTTNV